MVGRLGNRLSCAVRAGVDGYEFFQSNPTPHADADTNSDVPAATVHKIHGPPRSKGTMVGRLGNWLSSAVRTGVDGMKFSNPIQILKEEVGAFCKALGK